MIPSDIIDLGCFNCHTGPMNLLLLFISITLFTSCGNKDNISPFSPVKTLAETQGIDPGHTVFQGEFTFDEIDIHNPVGKLPVPIIGDFIQDLVGIFADIVVYLSQDWEVDQKDHYIKLPEINPEYIESIQITKLQFSIKESPEKILPKKPRLDFIEKIEIYLATEEMLKEKTPTLFSRYNYDRKELRKCSKKCLKLKIEKDHFGNPINLVPLLAGQSKLYLIPKVEIKRTPKLSLKIQGLIGFKVKLKLPF